MNGRCAHLLPHNRRTLTTVTQKGYKLGDPILHIELRSWADIVLVAPCSANTLAKIAGGQCDNLAVRQSIVSLCSSLKYSVDLAFACACSDDTDVYLSSHEHFNV